MKLKLITSIAVLLLWIPGCQSDFGTGAAVGTGAGSLLTHTIAGAKKDLEAREQALIQAYNEGVETGAKEEDLANVEKELEWARRTKEGVEAGEKLLSIDWNNPQEVGLGLGGVIGWALLLLKRRASNVTVKELKGTQAGINKFCGLHDPKVASELYDTVKEKVNAAKLV